MALAGATAQSGALLRELGDGLVMRRGAIEDAEALADFQAITNSSTEEPDEGIRQWTWDLASGGMPGFDPSDFVIVEDTLTGAVVSSLNLISQTWTYGGVEFDVGRIELVATHPDYRRRGLVRAQMDVVHEWSAARSELVQGITGIPWYYRQFGYEMALESWGGRWGETPAATPELAGPTAQYVLRPAATEDLRIASRLYDRGYQRYLVSCARGHEMWRYDLDGRSDGAAHRRKIRVIEDSQGTLVGCLMHEPRLSRKRIVVTLFELAPGVSWEAVAPAVVRYLKETGQKYAARDGADFGELFWALGSEHPAYEVSDLMPQAERPYAWYLRVPDLPAFVSRIASVLEKNLASSPAAGYSGDLKISFVGDGLRIAFEDGRLTVAERWMPTQLDSRLSPRVRDALFPDLTFLQLLFGFRLVEDLEYAFPDCRISADRAREPLNGLFPKRASHVWAIE